MNNVALLARGPIVLNLTSHFGMNYLISNLASMAALLVLRFALADWIIWRTKQSSVPRLVTVAYHSDNEVQPMKAPLP